MHQRLRRLRQQRRWSMREAARRIGVPETTYREWEYGRSIRGEWYPKIARAFGVGLAELFGAETAEHGSVEEWLDRIIADLKLLKKKLVTSDGG